MKFKFNSKPCDDYACSLRHRGCALNFGEQCLPRDYRPSKDRPKSILQDLMLIGSWSRVMAFAATCRTCHPCSPSCCTVIGVIGARVMGT